MAKPYFVFISALDCGPCNQFKQYWPPIKASLEKIANVVEIAVPSRLITPDPSIFPKSEIQRWYAWFPTFLLVEDSAWNGVFTARIFNGKMVGGRPTQDGNIQPNLANFTAWINSLPPAAPPHASVPHAWVPPPKEASKESETPIVIPKKKKLISSIRGPAFEIAGYNDD
jgi:hypothetical protein